MFSNKLTISEFQSAASQSVRRAYSTLRTLFAVSLLAMLAGCFAAPEEPAPDTNPLLYEIAGPDGEVEGWMLGTIHLLPDDTPWRTAAISKAVDSADMLIVEIADMTDQQAIGRLFAELGTTHGLPTLAQRVPPSKRETLEKLIARSGLSANDFTAIETWAAALMLAQTGSLGDADNGVDRAILAEFVGKDIREFEGAFTQLSIFDRMAEEDQRVLLTSTVQDPARAEAEAKELLDAWLKGNEAALEEATVTGAMRDQQVRNALLVDRNRAWIEKLAPILKTEEKPLVAVGAAHLVGDDGLPAMLEKQGYTVRRMEK